MTCTNPHLGSASDWLCRVGIFFQPIRSTTKIWVVHVIVTQTSFCEGSSDQVGDLAKRRLSQASCRVIFCHLPASQADLKPFRRFRDCRSFHSYDILCCRYSRLQNTTHLHAQKRRSSGVENGFIGKKESHGKLNGSHSSNEQRRLESSQANLRGKLLTGGGSGDTLS